MVFSKRYKKTAKGIVWSKTGLSRIMNCSHGATLGFVVNRTRGPELDPDSDPRASVARVLTLGEPSEDYPGRHNDISFELRDPPSEGLMGVVFTDLEMWARATMHTEVFFETAPSPCEGILTWQVNVTAFIDQYVAISTLANQIDIGVLQFTQQDVDSDPAVPTQLLPQLLGSGAFSPLTYARTITFGQSFEVKYDQISRFWFLCYVTMTIKGGWEREGSCRTAVFFDFWSPPGGHLGLPNGLRYETHSVY